MFLVNIAANYRDIDFSTLEKWTSIDDNTIMEIFKSSMKELLILRTCNRFEIYLVPKKDPSHDIDVLFSRFGKAKILYDMDAVRHIIEVSAGMDSMVPGEQDIQRQVKEALNISIKNNTSGKIINYVFMKALNISKVIRSETMISNGIVSIPQAAVKILKDFLDNGNIAIIGTGKVSHSLLKYLKESSYNITVFGRNEQKLENIKNEYHVNVDIINNLKSRLHEFNGLISALSIQEPLLKKGDFSYTNPSIIIDLGNPRNIERVIGRNYIDLEYIKGYVERNIIKRRNEMERAEKIIDEKLPLIEERILSLEIEELIKYLFERANKIRDEELVKSIKILGEDSREILELYGNSIIKKIYSHIIHNLKSKAKTLTKEDLELIKSILGE